MAQSIIFVFLLLSFLVLIYISSLSAKKSSDESISIINNANFLPTVSTVVFEKDKSTLNDVEFKNDIFNSSNQNDANIEDVDNNENSTATIKNISVVNPTKTIIGEVSSIKTVLNTTTSNSNKSEADWIVTKNSTASALSTTTPTNNLLDDSGNFENSTTINVDLKENGVNKIVNATFSKNLNNVNDTTDSDNFTMVKDVTAGSKVLTTTNLLLTTNESTTDDANINFNQTKIAKDSEIISLTETNSITKDTTTQIIDNISQNATEILVTNITHEKIDLNAKNVTSNDLPDEISAQNNISTTTPSNSDKSLSNYSLTKSHENIWPITTFDNNNEIKKNTQASKLTILTIVPQNSSFSGNYTTTIPLIATISSTAKILHNSSSSSSSESN